jgi:hypothetical protein
MLKCSGRTALGSEGLCSHRRIRHASQQTSVAVNGWPPSNILSPVLLYTSNLLFASEVSVSVSHSVLHRRLRPSDSHSLGDRSSRLQGIPRTECRPDHASVAEGWLQSHIRCLIAGATRRPICPRFRQRLGSTRQRGTVAIDALYMHLNEHQRP